MKEWQQRLMAQTKQAVKQHLKTSQEEWNCKVEEAVGKSTSLALKLVREPHGLAKGYIVGKSGQIS